MPEHTAQNVKGSRKIAHLPLRARVVRGRAQAERKLPPAQLIQFPVGKPRNPQPIEAKSFDSVIEGLKELDLISYLIKRPGSTIYVRATTNGLCDANIYADDLLIVDLCEKGEAGDIVLITRNGVQYVERLSALEQVAPTGIVRGKVLFSIHDTGKGREI
ncbi:MAG TPA: hypothetical protein VGC87_23180 [Pyrinomonadaceae bacterium]|jgi:hypothetical protein